MPFVFEPEHMFGSSMKSLLETIEPKYKILVEGGVNVVMTDTGLVDAASKRRTIKKLGYEVTVHRGLLSLMTDAIHILMARTRIVSATGDTLVPEDLSEAEASDILRELIRSYVTHGSWHSSPAIMRVWEAGLKRRQEPAGRHRKDPLLFVMHMAYFVMAHELAHIMYGHCDEPPPGDRAQAWANELHADEAAASIHARYIVRNTIGGRQDLTDSERQVYIVTRATSLVAVTILFELFSAIGRAARAMGLDWEKTHPPADLRYERFRDMQVSKGLCRPELFSEPVAGMDSPEFARHIFHHLVVNAA